MDWPSVLLNLAGSAIGGSVAAGLFKLLSDRSIEKQKGKQSRELLEAQNAFSMGATSHMASVAFDKHIGFCEEYVKEMSEALRALIQDRTTEEALDAKGFFRIRQKWALWLTHEMEDELDRFELRIKDIGGAAQVFEANGAPASNEGSVKNVIAYLRQVLRTEELTALRNEMVMRSLKESPQVL